MSMKRIGTLVILGCLLLTMTACGNESKDTPTLPSTIAETKEDLSARKTENDTVDCNTDSDKEVKREPIIINLQSTKFKGVDVARDRWWGTIYPSVNPYDREVWFCTLLAELVQSDKNKDKWNFYQEDARMVRPVTPTSEPMVINLGLQEPLPLGRSIVPEAGELRCETLLNYFIESKECEKHFLDVMVKIYPYGDLTLEDEVKRLSDEGFTFTETHGFVYCGRFTGKQLQNFPKNEHCGYEIGWNMFD